MPADWHELYDGPEERVFFVGRDGRGGLVRGETPWRSVGVLAEETGLSPERVAAIAAKYVAEGVVVASPEHPDHFAYWGRLVPPAPRRRRPVA
jgi:hypothetical protein